jgi:radical SAM superfamily enzyme YgiQ (UPF0313 family)
VYSYSILPRLGLPILGTILRNRGHQVRIYCEDVQQIDFGTVMTPDLVGLSTTTSTAPEAYRIAQRVSRKGIPVVFGGAHTTFMPEEALQYGDFCIAGEAEESFPLLVQHLTAEEAWTGIPGLSYWRGGEMRHNPPQPGPPDLDAIPIPDLNLVEGSERISIAPVMTSRGCPYNCNFCTVTKIFGRQYRFRSTENVIEELGRTQRDSVFFYDDNFTASPERTKQLLEEMIRQKLTPKWSAQVRVDAAKDRELLELMRRSNCNRVFIGFESVIPETLVAYRKRQTVEEIEESIQAFQSVGIKVHGMFVLGSDEDDKTVARKTADFARKKWIDTVQLLILTPVPGTEVYQQLDEAERIFTKRWELYDGLHVVFEPAKMSPFELQKEMIRGMARFYSLKGCVRDMVRFDFVSAFVRYNGRQIVRRWRRANKRVVEQLKFYRFWENPYLYLKKRGLKIPSLRKHTQEAHQASAKQQDHA